PAPPRIYTLSLHDALPIFEGDADHPINRGTLCPKGSSLQQDILNPRRLMKPQVRRPGSDHWEDIAWDTALDEVGHWVKKTRDASDRKSTRLNSSHDQISYA